MSATRPIVRGCKAPCAWRGVLAAICAAVPTTGDFATAQDAAYVDKIRVAADTRLDWAYPLLQRSPAVPPVELLKGYRSTAQAYEFFGPVEDGGGPYPLVIFISPQDRPVGWYFWEPTCAERGVLFAGVREMGNARPLAHRVRAVLDVLDDVRRRFRIDPDRTYLAGFSGGAQVACVTALHLPEYFGGVVCIGHAPAPPLEPWLLARVRQRLSVAIICGDREPAGPLVEDLYGPWWTGAGVRVEPVILRRHGHTMPEADVMESAYEWLEAGAAARGAAAATHPSLRIADAPSRDEWAERLLIDAKARLADPAEAELVAAGLAQLEGIVQRWPDAPAATTAQWLLDEHAARDVRPWKAVADAERVKLLTLQAEGYTRLASDGRKTVGQRRGQYAKIAISLWQQLREVSRDAAVDADAQIAALEKIAVGAPDDAGLIPLDRVRFDMSGDVTLAQGIEYLRVALARLGYELAIDEAAAKAAGVDFDKLYHPRLNAVTLDDVDRRFLRRAGLKMQRRGKIVTLVPVAPK